MVFCIILKPEIKSMPVKKCSWSKPLFFALKSFIGTPFGNYFRHRKLKISFKCSPMQ